MTTRKTLTSIVLAGAVALGAAGCSTNHSQYLYDGKIGEDQVKFTEKRNAIFFDENILTVIKPDGRVIKYVDQLGNNLIIESVEITANEQTTKYKRGDEVGKPILEEAQKQFDAYLNLIKETRIKQGLGSLK